MDNEYYILPSDTENSCVLTYRTDISKHFSNLPEVAKPLIKGAKNSLNKIREMLYSAPAFINAVKASVPEEVFKTVLTNEQKAKLANGTLELMTKKDGTLMANLVNPKNKRIVSTISLKRIKVNPDITQAMTSYAMQMQLAQIAEQIQSVQTAVEEVRQGQEYDRLATAYSCQQKLLQAIAIKNPQLKAMALLRIVADAEDSRNLLMLSQNANVSFIKDQPESFIGKFLSGAPSEKIDIRMNEIRESLCALNMVSFVEAMAYQEMGETEVAQQSLWYYADYIQKVYLEPEKLIERLNSIDPLPENYWLKVLPDIEKKIKALPCFEDKEFIGG